MDSSGHTPNKKSRLGQGWGSADSWIRTNDLGLMNPSTTAENKGLTSRVQHAAQHKAQVGLPADPNLRAIVEAWPDLPEAVQAGIMAMVKVVTYY